MLIIRISLIDVFEQLDLVQALVKVVLIVLHAYANFSCISCKCLNAYADRINGILLVLLSLSRACASWDKD